jgi:hypothetical protein
MHRRDAHPTVVASEAGGQRPAYTLMRKQILRKTPRRLAMTPPSARPLALFLHHRPSGPPPAIRRQDCGGGRPACPSESMKHEWRFREIAGRTGPMIAPASDAGLGFRITGLLVRLRRRCVVPSAASFRAGREGFIVPPEGARYDIVRGASRRRGAPPAQCQTPHPEEGPCLRVVDALVAWPAGAPAPQSVPIPRRTRILSLSLALSLTSGTGTEV